MRLSHRVRLGSALLASALVSSCCVRPAKHADVLAMGFRDPLQAFQTLQTAVRLDDAREEFRCFSGAFRRENQISLGVYFEVRDEIKSRNPFLRKGLSEAKVVAGPELRGDVARLVAEAFGKRLEVFLVREDFAQLYEGGRLVLDEYASFEEHTGVQAAADGRSWMFGRTALPAGNDGSAVSELRFGREWKLDSIRELDDRSPKAENLSPREEIPPSTNPESSSRADG